MKNWFLLMVLVGMLATTACGPDSSSQQEGQAQTDVTTPAPAPAESLEIVPGKYVGLIQAGFSEADIIAAYGQENVRREEFKIGEGETTPATTVFPDTDKELVVLWKAEAPFERMEQVRIEKADSPWRTTQDVKIGTTLEQLIILNGKEFNFHGFEWDYAGLAKDWNGGFLHDKLEVFLAAENPEAIYPHLLGDELFSSGNLKARAADLLVDVMVIRF